MMIFTSSIKGKNKKRQVAWLLRFVLYLGFNVQHLKGKHHAKNLLSGTRYQRNQENRR